jgi:ABC-2 type transport system permease protein
VSINMDVAKLWQDRARAYWNRAMRYLRLILNDGFLFALFVLFLVCSYYYGQLIDALPETFPASLVLSVFLTFFTVKGRVRTFLKKADLVFLLPVEEKLDAYFQKSVLYSYCFQAFYLIISLIVAAPLFLEFVSFEKSTYFLIGLALLGLKSWNLLASWEEDKLPTSTLRLFYALRRSLVSFVFIFLLLELAPIYLLLIVVVLLAVLHMKMYLPIRKQHSLQWEHLLTIENSMIMAFYRIANLFTDVPELQHRIKSRKIAAIFTSKLPFRQQSVFRMLYVNTFFRSNDYFGMYVRLVIIGAVLVYALPEGIGRLLVFALFIYLTGQQISTLWPHHTGNMWTELYPISESGRKQAFQRLVVVLLMVESFIFFVAALLSGSTFTTGLLLLAVGILVSAVYAFGLLNRYITRKWSEEI